MKPISRFNVRHSYNVTMTEMVELPEGKTTDDIDTCYVKYGTFFCSFKDGTEFEEDIFDSDLGEYDYKRPHTVEIVECDSDGNDISNNDYAEVFGL